MMLLTPVPGADRKELLRLLQQFETDAVNLRTNVRNAPPFQTYYKYLEWASRCVRMLSGQIRMSEAVTLFQTPRYELLLGVGNNHDIARILMEQELDDRIAALKTAQTDMSAEFARWTTPGRLIVFDTVVYMEHPEKLEELDFWEMLGEHNRPINLIAPITVIDELDNLKNRGHEGKKWRAAYSLAVLDRVASSPATAVAGAAFGHILREADDSNTDATGGRQGAVTVEVLLDPPEHGRLANTDDEIVDRAMSVQLLAGKPVTVVSYDTGMIMRARTAGLDVVKLVKAYGRAPKI